jgi:hypothetical protein
MSTPVKIILAVFGLLFVVVAGCIGALFYFGHSLLQSATDPASQQRIAAKLGKFTVPPGYHISQAMDFGGRQEIDLAPDAKGNSFTIKLTGGASPDNGAAQSQGVDLGLKFVGGMAKCDFVAQPDDELVIMGKKTSLSVRACPHAPIPMRVESGSITDDVVVLALGAGTDFDRAALHELLESFK